MEVLTEPSGRRAFAVLAFALVLEAPAAFAEEMDGAEEAAKVALATDSLAADSEGSDAEFDPFDGIDRNGRIPATDRPEEFEHPGRWRYIPEGRLKPGNIFERFFVSSFISPLFFRNEDVGTGGGLALIDIDFRAQRRREFGAIFASYTSEGQQRYSILWQRWLHHVDAPGGGVFQEERSKIQVFAGYSKTLTRRFFGIGATSDENQETSYTDRLFEVSVGIERAVPDPGDDLVVEADLGLALHRLSDGEVDDRPSMNDLDLLPGPGQRAAFAGTNFPAIFNESRDHNAGWLGLGLRWDTRDGQINPYSGWVIGGRMDAALAQTDGDVGAIFSLRGSRVFEVWPLLHDGGDELEEHPPTDTIAFNLEAQQVVGDLPFFNLPQLGGSDAHRGFVRGRFRDRAAWIFGAEWRPWVIARGFTIPFTETLRVERIGLAAFYEIGSVANDVGELFRAKVHHSYGAGLRITLERQAIFRVDLGFSDEDVIVSANFGLPF